jgi:hypothetical protein
LQDEKSVAENLHPKKIQCRQHAEARRWQYAGFPNKQQQKRKRMTVKILCLRQ